METLLEVGLVEALAAALFVGFCLFISYLLQPRKVYERRLAQMLDQIAAPERPAPPQLTYRGAPYVAPVAPDVLSAPIEAAPLAVPQKAKAEAEPAASETAPVVRLTYRGVPYGQISVASSEDVSSGDRPPS